MARPTRQLNAAELEFCTAPGQGRAEARVPGSGGPSDVSQGWQASRGSSPHRPGGRDGLEAYATDNDPRRGYVKIPFLKCFGPLLMRGGPSPY